MQVQGKDWSCFGWFLSLCLVQGVVRRLWGQLGDKRSGMCHSKADCYDFVRIFNVSIFTPSISWQCHVPERTDRQTGGGMLAHKSPRGVSSMETEGHEKAASAGRCRCCSMPAGPSVCSLTDKMGRPAHGSRAGLCNSCGFQPYLSREGAACPARVVPLISIFTCQWQADVQGAKARPSLNSCSGEGVT